VSDVDIICTVNKNFREYAEKFWKGKTKVENLSLILEKAPPFVKGYKDEYYKSSLSSVNKIFKNVKHFESFVNDLIRESLNEYKTYFEVYTNFVRSKFKRSPIRLKTKSRLIIGLGDESVYETSIRLHRNYGVPYIPGSALKGLAKHYSIYMLTHANIKFLTEKFSSNDFFELAGKVQKLLEEPEDEKAKEFETLSFSLNREKISFVDLREIFGTQKQEGSIIFFDSFPTPDQLRNNPILELDIMNPHYQPYYSASENELKSRPEKAPGDWHQPNPIFFLTVPAGVEFQFAIAPREGFKKNQNNMEILVTKSKSLLLSALENFGIGGKTSWGYGRFGD